MRVAAAVLLSALLAACSSTGEPSFDFTSPALNGSDAAATDPATADAAGGEMALAGGQATAGEGDMSLPEQVAVLPMLRPGEAADTAPTAAAAEQTPEAPEQEAAIAVAAAKAEAAAPAAPGGQVLENGGQILTAGVMPEAPPIEPKKKSFLSAFFGSSPAAAAPAPSPVREKPKPLVKIEEKAPEAKPVRVASLGGGEGGDFALPGVRQSALFEIKRKSGLDDDSDVDLHEEEEYPPVRVASAAGLARLAPNGLLKQRETVDVGCLKPSLVRMLKQIEGHYGKKMVVTSGYRNPAYNRKVNGAKKSMHMFCAAVDVQIPGVSKWELAQYARSMTGRGGVGTYCHTESVHIDVGPERDWNWRCRRRKS